ncbi:MAG: hypothetical protein UW73_C0018G0024 [Microgenomates group bacterium GW2011_GWB1_44_8]|nr:MAG: hypothetical protein UW73_C0018G0024 [Microgenomates group bacterium GW2011_GWB1_44_8]
MITQFVRLLGVMAALGLVLGVATPAMAAGTTPPRAGEAQLGSCGWWEFWCAAAAAHPATPAGFPTGCPRPVGTPAGADEGHTSGADGHAVGEPIAGTSSNRPVGLGQHQPHGQAGDRPQRSPGRASQVLRQGW